MARYVQQAQSTTTRIDKMTAAQTVTTSIAPATIDPTADEFHQVAAFNDTFQWETSSGLPTYIQDLVGEDVRDKPVLPQGFNELGSVTWQLDAGVAITPQKGVITYAFPDAQHKGGIYNSYHWGQYFGFYDWLGYTPFTEAQRVSARISIQNWDDLIAPTFKEVNGAGGADITFQNTYTNLPGEGAHAYYPYEFGVPAFRHVESDVWMNDPRVDSSILQLYPGGYGLQAVNHEIGHTLGLTHPGNYNATDDNDGIPGPDPITYQNDAFYFQDSQQFTIMSYFNSHETGAQEVDWNFMRLMYPSTPMVDDVFVIQQKYGADMTTRTGATTYGFNATTDVTNEAMRFHTGELATVFTIWDANGNDTLDLSGYYTPSVIDLREGAYSSAGGWGAYDPALLGVDPASLTSEQLLAIVNGYNTAAGLSPRIGPNLPGYGADYFWRLYFQGNVSVENDEDGNPIYLNGGVSWKDMTGSDTAHYLMQQNIGIAYGAVIENAIGGHGDDRINGNQANNRLTGGEGHDTFVIADYSGLIPLPNNPTRMVTDYSVDTITDFHTGEDRIDLTSFGHLTAADISYTNGDLHFTANGHDYSVHLLGAAIDLNSDIIYG